MVHRIRLTDNQEGKVDPDYLHDVEVMTARRVAEFVASERKALAVAEKRAARADRRLEAARSVAEKRRARTSAAVAWELVEIRREELGRIEALMKQAPASATHRGDKSFRPLPARHSTFT